MKTLLITVLLGFYTQVALASIFAGVVVKKQGAAEVLTNPSKSVQGKGPHVLYNGTYYTQKKVQPGTRIKNGNIVKTGKDSKLKIVFKNGDQINVGEGTSYEVKWKSPKHKNAPKASIINIIHGSIRGIISKKGPRSGLKVRSKNAVMGIRGTDFYFGQKGSSGKTSISVLRGAVHVKDPKNPKEILNLKQDFSAEIMASTKKTSAISLNKTTKNELVKIQKNSKIDKKKADKIESKTIKKELASLEKKAISNTLDDIKDYNPALYQKLKSKDIKNVDTLNTIVVAKAFKKAPKKKIKKGFDDLNLGLDEDAYEKYFKVDENI